MHSIRLFVELMINPVVSSLNFGLWELLLHGSRQAGSCDPELR